MSQHSKDQDSAGRGRLWTRLFYGLCAALVLVGVALERFTHAFDHVHFSFEAWPGFYGVFGFAAFVFIVQAGKLLRKLVARDEDFYDEPPPRTRK